MTRKSLIILAACFLISCNTTEAKKSNSSPPANQSSSSTAKTQTSTTKPGNYWQKLEMREIKDGSGMVAALIPLPTSWKMNVGGASFVGPNGIKVTDLPLKSFMQNYDQSLQHVYIKWSKDETDASNRSAN